MLSKQSRSYAELTLHSFEDLLATYGARNLIVVCPITRVQYSGVPPCPIEIKEELEPCVVYLDEDDEDGQEYIHKVTLKPLFSGQGLEQRFYACDLATLLRNGETFMAYVQAWNTDKFAGSYFQRVYLN